MLYLPGILFPYCTLYVDGEKIKDRIFEYTVEINERDLTRVENSGGYIVSGSIESGVIKVVLYMGLGKENKKQRFQFKDMLFRADENKGQIIIAISSNRVIGSGCIVGEVTKKQRLLGDQKENE